MPLPPSLSMALGYTHEASVPGAWSTGVAQPMSTAALLQTALVVLAVVLAVVRAVVLATALVVVPVVVLLAVAQVEGQVGVQVVVQPLAWAA